MKALIVTFEVILFVLFLTSGVADVAASSTISVRLIDSSGMLLTDCSLKYYDGGWQTAAQNGDGTFTIISGATTLSYEMTYANSKQTLSGIPATEDSVVFQTINTTIQLKNSQGDLIDEGSVQFYSGGWYDLGITTGGVLNVELLANNYPFKMTYEHGSNQKSQDIGGDPVVVFTTVKARVQLESSLGDPLDTGYVQYYASGWRELGATVNGEAAKELLPNNYPFRMTYEHGSNQKSQDIGGDPVVVFTTVKARVQLESSLGDPLDTGYIQYYASGWRDLGATVNGEAAKELLPNNYPFRMTYEYGSNQKSQDIGSNPIVVFPTVNTIVQLKDSSGVLIDPGTVKYYASGWWDFGQTSGGQAEKELLPNNYPFRMTYEYGSNQKSQDIGVDPVVVFTTVKARVQLESSLGDPLDTGYVQYYASGWRDLGTTVNGESAKELLPNNYPIRMTYEYGSNQKSQDIGSNPIVVFPTVNTIVQLKDSSGVLIDPGTVKYYASGWRDFGQTSGGQAEKELLPKNYTFRMISDFGTEQKAQDTGVDPIVIFQVAGAPTYPELVLQQPAQGLITNDANIAVSGSVDDANTVVTVNGEPVTVQADGSFTTTITAVEGQNTITVVATNVENNSRTEIRNIILDTTKPAIAVFSPDDETYTNEDSIQIVGNVFDSTETTLTIDGQNAILDTDNNFFFDFNLQNGLNDIHFVAQDAAGNFRYDTLSVYLDTTAPVIGSVNPAEGSTVDISRPVIEITFSDDLSGLDFSTLNVLLNTDNISNDFVINGNIASFSTSAELQDGIYTLDISVNDNAGNSLNNHISTFTIETEELPSDPVEVATPLKTTEVTSFLDANMFLYSGPDPIQTGADSAAFDERRTAILRGKTLNSNGESISGVTVTILDHDEYGQTLTRSDGYFDMAVNGGGILTVSFEKNGLFSVQRTVDVPWQDFVELDSVVMINEDTKVSLIDFSEDVQVHRGSIVSDDDGTRQANLFFKQGMQAQIILPDSSILNLDSMHVRVTEYTVGDNGPQAMPANLPDNIAYTYCVELSVDEAVAMNAEKVEFDSPVYVYVDNFLGFPVGLDVPSGYYDRKLKGWVPSENGKVIEIVGINNGLAEIDADGDGIAEDANSLLTLGFNDAERSRLADIYSSGSTLWRVGVSHFSAWDFNWSYGLPGDAKAANQEKASNKEDQVENPCKGEGSIIGIQDQDLRQQIPVVGTEFSLNYSSKRMYGRIPYLDIPLSGSSIPASLLRIDLYVKIAGKTNKFSYPPISNLTKRFIWDRKDVYGRIVWGSQKVKISIAYVYEAVYKTSSEISKDFAQFGDAVTDVRTRQEIEVWQKYNTTLTSWYNPNMELGGWSINVNHKYDPVNGVLAYGDGTFRNANFLGNSITTVAGNGEYGYDGDGGMANAASMGWVTDVAIGPNGNIFICDPDYSVIRMIDSSGIISTVAGGGDGGGGTIIGAAATSLPTTNHVELGDGGPATEASLFYPSQIAVGGDGSLYIADTFNNLIRIVDQNGIISTIAGNEDWGYSENGTLAIESELMFPMGIAIGPDGLIYFADESYVRRINADGTLTTIAGNDEPSGVPEDGLLATDIGLYYPNALNFDKDGNLYIADNTLNRILKVTPEGLIYVVAGSGAIYYPGSYIFPPGRGDGGLATEAIIYEPSDVVFGPDGSMYISESSNNNIRKVSPGGIISRYAGRYSPSDEANLPEIGDGDFAPSAYLNYPQGVAVSQNSELYIIDGGHNKLRKVSENLFHSSNNIIASEDGSEL